MSGADTECRADVWLWRARFFKTRALAAKVISAGRVRLTRPQGEIRLDKPHRTVRPGDLILFAFNNRLVSVRVDAVGERRGPPSEARLLYSPLDDEADEVMRPPSAGPEPAP